MSTDRSIATARNVPNIVGIFHYCDRWCERCGFTDRCLWYKARPEPGAVPPRDNRNGLLIDSEEAALAERARSHPIVVAGCMYTDLVGAWFDIERHALLARADRLVARTERAADGQALLVEAVRVREALQIIDHDRSFITRKLSRALCGRPGDTLHQCGRSEPVQSDSNGSAKVALISIDRSEAAWRILSEWMDGSRSAMLLAETLAQLRTQVEAEFPAARQFVRPGFDHESS